MTSEAYSVACRALRAGRRAFKKELAEFLSDASSQEISKEMFDKKREYFKTLWEEIVVSNNDCISSLDEDDDKEIIDDLDEELGELKEKEELNKLEGDLAKKLVVVVEDVKNVESCVTADDPSDNAEKLRRGSER